MALTKFKNYFLNETGKITVEAFSLIQTFIVLLYFEVFYTLTVSKSWEVFLLNWAFIYIFNRFLKLLIYVTRITL